MNSREPIMSLAIARSVVLLSFLIIPYTVWSQDIVTAHLRWTSTSTVDLKTSDPSSYNCVFISGPGEIQWLQKNGQSVKHFTIASTEGTWSDITAQGTMTFRVSEGSSQGTIVFEKTDSTTAVTMDFTSQNAAAIKRRFNVSNVQTEN